MRPSLGPVDVSMFEGWHIDGEQLKNAKITTLADTCVLWQWNGERFLTFDRLTEAKYVEHDNGTLTITGISDKMQEMVGLASGDSHVRWEVTVNGCEGC